jgi:hypothetical protein
MALNSSIRNALAGFFASLDHPLMMLVADEDLRVRQVIARTVTRMRPAPGLDSKTRWGERPGLAANPRVE